MHERIEILEECVRNTPMVQTIGNLNQEILHAPC